MHDTLLFFVLFGQIIMMMIFKTWTIMSGRMPIGQISDESKEKMVIVAVKLLWYYAMTSSFYHFTIWVPTVGGFVTV